MTCHSLVWTRDSRTLAAGLSPEGIQIWFSDRERMQVSAAKRTATRKARSWAERIRRGSASVEQVPSDLRSSVFSIIDSDIDLQERHRELARGYDRDARRLVGPGRTPDSGELVSALADAGRATLYAPDVGAYQMTLAWALLADGRPSEAERAARKAVELASGQERERLERELELLLERTGG